MKILIIDDELSRVNNITRYIKTIVDPTYLSDESVKHIEHFNLELFNQSELLFLDHDLASNGDMYDHIKEHQENIEWEHKTFIVHSMNPVGAKNIASLIFDYTNKVFVVPFSRM